MSNLLDFLSTNNLRGFVEAVSAGFDASAKINGQAILLHVCQKRNTHEFVNALIENRVDVNVTNLQGDTALHMACLTLQDKTVALLAEKNCRQVPNLLGQFPIHKIFDIPRDKMDEQVNLVLDRLIFVGKGDVNAKNKNGDTALHLAAMQGRVAIVEHLVSKLHASTTVVNEEGKTPLQVSRAEKVVEYLKDFPSQLPSQDAPVSSGPHILAPASQAIADQIDNLGTTLKDAFALDTKAFKEHLKTTMDAITTAIEELDGKVPMADTNLLKERRKMKRQEVMKIHHQHVERSEREREKDHDQKIVALKERRDKLQHEVADLRKQSRNILEKVQSDLCDAQIDFIQRCEKARREAKTKLQGLHHPDVRRAVEGYLRELSIMAEC